MPNEPTQCKTIPKPPDSSGDTPYGYWHCTTDGWVWIPEFGRFVQTKWNKFLYFFMSK